MIIACRYSKRRKKIKNMGTISGGNAKKAASWILRGNQAGSYYLSAAFSGKLMPFYEDITVSFETDEPLIVSDSDALSIEFFNIPDSDVKNQWDVEFVITNTSKKTIHNVKLDFSKLDDRFLYASEIIVEYPSGTIENIYWNGGDCNEKNNKQFLPALYGENEFIDSCELKPGESIVGRYTVTGLKYDEYSY